MSDFLVLSTDRSLWDPSAKVTWGSLDFCPTVMQFTVHAIMQRQLTALSQMGASGDVEKPQQDMAFVLIVPSLAIMCEWVFSLTAMWVHPHQAHLPTLEGAAQKLMLLANQGPNWLYVYAWMNDNMAHVPLSNERHIGIMTEGLASMNACGCLNQLQVQRLLQCGGQVVCPKGLNGSLDTLLFDFKELLLWNAANADEPTQDLPMIGVKLTGMEPKVPPSTRVEDPLGLNLRGALKQLQWASPAAPSSPSQYITSRTQLPSVAQGDLSPAGEAETSPRSMGTEFIIHTPVVTLSQTSPWTTPPGSSHGSAHSTPQPFWPTGPRTLEAGSIPCIKWPLASLECKPTSLSKELLQLQEVMNTALEKLLEVRASMYSCHRELDFGAELAVHHNDAQLAEAKICHAATAAVLQWAHLDSISALNSEVMAEEGQKCQAFTKKFSVVL